MEFLSVCLLSREEIDRASREPDYNAIARVEKVREPRSGRPAHREGCASPLE